MEVVSDKKITRLVTTEGKTRVYELEDGTWLTARDGTVAWRNNNPGKLRFGFKDRGPQWCTALPTIGFVVMKTGLRALTATLAMIFMSGASAGTPPKVPAEVAAAAPAGTTLLTFKSSGDRAEAYAVAVYETAPDQDGVRYRSLIIFGTKDGKFIPDVASDKLIACSRCSQFHDDPLAFSHLILTPGHIRIDQMAAGEEPSVVVLDFAYKLGKWYVTRAVRELWGDAGRHKSATEGLPLPKSGLVQDMDARWSIPTYFNAIFVNDTTGKFSFLHGYHTQAEIQEKVASDCSGKDCRVVVLQRDGCMSLVRDSSGKSFGAGVPAPTANMKADAVSKAMAACTSTGGQMCKEIKTDCYQGNL